MAEPVVRLEVLSVEYDGETRYGVMEVRRYKTGLGFVVHYGPHSMLGNSSDWGTIPDDEHNMRVMAEALFFDVVSHVKHR